MTNKEERFLERKLMGVIPFVIHRTLQEDNPSGVILSTDDYFYINGQYQFDVKYLGEAHEWNQNRGKSRCEGLHDVKSSIKRKFSLGLVF